MGELGRCSISNYRCLKAVKFWLQVLNMNDNRHLKICYKLQCKWLNHNLRTDCWAGQIKELLEAIGFGYAWYNQNIADERLFVSQFYERLIDINIQCWRKHIEDMSKL